PIGFLKGMAVTYARVLCKFVQEPEPGAPPDPGGEQRLLGDPLVAKMAAGISAASDTTTDAVARFSNELLDFGGDLAGDGRAVLRGLFTILVGLGMLESSGKPCVGVDGSKQVAATATNAEAGLFQMSFDIGVGVPGNDFKQLYDAYQRRPDSGFSAIFNEGVVCAPSDI